MELSDYYPYGQPRVHDTYNGFDDRKGYIGKDYDINTELSYLEARYYNGKRGQFIGQDPMFWILPQELLIDPQQQNSYSYARGNPINGKDPSGLLTAIIPGTRYNKKDWSRTGKAKDFIKSVEKTFGEEARILFWSGKNNKNARENAANFLTKFISNYKFAKGEKLNIVGHSHGGNIGILTSQKTDRKIDTLVTLGTSIRSDYQPNYDMIDKHINAYSNIDPVQIVGGQAFGGLGLKGTVPGSTGSTFQVPVYYGFIPAGRKFDGAENVNVTIEAGFPGIHSNLWQNSGVWSKVSDLINN